MHSFKTSDGRSWTVRLNYGKVQIVKSMTGYDLLDVAEGGSADVLSDISVNMSKVVTLMMCFVEEQLQPAGVKLEDFTNSIDGSTLAAFAKVFVEEWVDFFNQAGSPAMAEALKKQDLVVKQAMGMAREELQTLDMEPAIKKEVVALRQSLESGEYVATRTKE